MGKVYKEFNMNQTIKVKLKDEGRDIYYHQYDSWIHNTNLKPSYPTVDEEGYTEFQMWRFIELYGKYIKFDKDQPFNLNILIEFDD